MSPAKSAASSPPAPARISTITSRSSSGSGSSIAARSSSSIGGQPPPGGRPPLALEVGLHLGVGLARGKHGLRVLERRAQLAPALREGMRRRQPLVTTAELAQLDEIALEIGVGETPLDLGVGILDLYDQRFHEQELRRASRHGAQPNRSSHATVRSRLSIPR